MDSALRVSLRDPTPLLTALFGPVHISLLFWGHSPCHGPAKPSLLSSSCDIISLQSLKPDRLPVHKNAY